MMPTNTNSESNREPSPFPSSMDEWKRQKSQIAIESDSEGSDHNRQVLETSRRSMSSRTATGTCATTGSDSLVLSSDSKKKKKKEKKKSKKSKTKKDKDKESDKKKKTRRKEAVTMDDDNHSTVTESEEKIVDELCTFLSNTLSNGNKTESFLRLLSASSAQQTASAIPEEDYGDQYNALQSPEPSVCGSYSSHFTTMSTLRSDVGHSRSWWTAVDAPSISSGVTSNRSMPRYSQREPSIRGPAHKSLREPTMGSAELVSPLSAISSSLKGAGIRHSNPPSVAVTGRHKLDIIPSSESPSLNRKNVALPGGSMSELRMHSALRHQMAGTEESTPEDLLFALPQEFRTYLLSLQEEEFEFARSNKNVKGRNETFLMSCGGTNLPLETRRDRDALSVVSELSALTGMVSHATKPMLYSPDGDFLAPDSIDDSSGDSDDSDDESQSSQAGLRPPSVVSHNHVHSRMPRRSSLSSGTGMVKPEQRRAVRFESVHVREFDTVLDCNPAVTEGPAIALGWAVLSETAFLISDKDDDRHRRYGDALMLSTHTREGILLKFGFSRIEIDAVVRRIQKAQNQRRRTAQK
ncbi:hypothetical protein MHU86_2187 [Fragilaria crotonensis]|nr:hypothetical protein MHU86_2187 [Fragilaria crotonensis]